MSVPAHGSSASVPVPERIRGIDRLGEKEKLLRKRYGTVHHPAAREIIAWLDGAYRITDEIVQTQ